MAVKLHNASKATTTQRPPRKHNHANQHPNGKILTFPRARSLSNFIALQRFFERRAR